MTLAPRYRALIALAGLLVLVNVWRWWPTHVGGKGPSATHSAAYRVEDFHFNAGEPSGRDAVVARDLFHPKVVVVAKPAPKPVEAPPPPPAKTPEELEAEAAQAELAQIKFVGMAARGGKEQAFLVKGNELYTVMQGDKVGSRFVVEKLTPTTITLKDPRTQVSGNIPISGK